MNSWKNGSHRGTVLAAGMALFLAGPVLAQTFPGTAVGPEPFEVHGSLFSGSAPSGFLLGDGWAQGASFLGVLDENGLPAKDAFGVPYRASRQIDPNWGNQGHGIDTSVFASGNKNHDLIGSSDSPWGWDIGGGGPQKNDITNAYFHTRADPITEDRWVFVAAETRSTNGDSHADFEYNQAGVAVLGETSGQIVGLGPDGGRTVNDFLISIDFQQGGEMPVASVRVWNGATFELVSLPNAVFSAANLVNIAHGSAGSWKHFTDDGAETDVLTRLQLVEAGVNLTALGILVNPCNTNSTFMVKTRSSASWTSDLKDFALVHFPIEPAPEIEFSRPDDVCFGETFDVTATELTGLPNTTLDWNINGCGSIVSDPFGSTVTVQADAVCGCQMQLSVTVTGGLCSHRKVAETLLQVDDNTNPTLDALPPDELVECDAIPQRAELAAIDDCVDPQVNYTEQIVPGDCEGESTLLRNWEAVDDCDNKTDQTQVIVVRDTTSPTVEGVPEDQTVACDNVPAPPEVTAVDNCSTPTVALSEQTQPGSCGANYTILRTWRGTDACGNTTSHEQRIEVQDVAAPVLSGVPSDVTYECDSLPPPGEVTADDNCTTVSIDLAETTAPGNCQGSSIVSRTWTAGDECGNSSHQRQVITLQDTTPPTIENGPAGATVECSDLPPPVNVTAVDNCSDPVVTLVEQTEPGPGAGKGIITRTWTAQDNCGNTSTHTQVLNVIDTIAPTLDGVPGDVTVECSAVPSPAIVAASDNCASPAAQFSETVEQGDCDGKWTIRRTWRATDDCGNTVSQTQVITVVDSTPPTFGELPVDLTAECDNVPVPATVTASDLCSDALVELVETSDVGTCAGKSTIRRTWVARDSCGNESRHTQTIQIVDTTVPTITDGPGDAVAQCDAVPAPAEVSAQDNCISELNIDFGETTTPGVCAGIYTLQREWSTSDACGNTTSHTQRIEVQDNAAPVLHGVPADTTYECDSLPPPGEVTVDDNCTTASVSLVESAEPGVCEGSSTVSRTWTAEDECGNSSNQQQVITLEDTTPPTIENGPADATVECSDVPPPAIVTAVDNCSDPVVTLAEQTEPGAGAGKSLVMRTWTARDSCGNAATHTQMLIVVDTIAPTLDGVPGDVTVECSAVPTPVTVTASDNCASPETLFSETIEQGDCEGKWTILRTWTATDDCGNTTSQTQTITVVDSTPPSFGELPDDLTAECDDVPMPVVVEATDLCSSASVDFAETSEVGTCSGESTISRTWVARDSCGNESRHIQTIQVVDTTAPAMSDDPVDTVAECDAVPAPAELSAQDNCTSDLNIDFAETSTPGSCEGNYTLQREWSTADDCGNSVAVNQVVTVQDTTAPTVQLDPDGTQYICNGKPVAFMLDSSDNCSQPALALEGLVTITANSRDRVNVTEFPDGSVRVTATGPALIMGTATASDDCGNASNPFRFTVTAEKGFEACSQGFWKNHYERWAPTGFSPDDLFLDAFQITDLSSPETPGDFNTSMTLREAINKTGGSFSQLLLQGTAALLSAAHPNVDFPFTPSEVRAIMQATFAGDLAMSDALAWINNGNAAEKECGCSIE